MVSQAWTDQPLFNIVRGGWIFFDCFFALSGFLVTSILLDTKSRPDYFRRFYRRRQLRILPLYLFAVTTVFIVSFFIEGRRVGITSFDSLLWYILFLPNLAITLKGDWLDHSSYLVINHFWAVGVEEQFYLLWPLIVYFIPRRALLFVTTSILVLGTPLRLLTGYISGNIWGLAPYTSTWCRMDAIAAGALVAILLRADRDRIRTYNNSARRYLFGASCLIGAAFLALAGWRFPAMFNPAAGITVKIDIFCWLMYAAAAACVAYRIKQLRNDDDMLRTILREVCKAVFATMLTRMIFDLGWGGGQEKFTHSTLCFGSCIYLLATTNTRTALRSFFESRFLVHIGFFSYGIYLFHHMFRPIYGRTIERWFFVNSGLNPFLAQFLYITVAGATSYICARISRILLEQPFMKLKG